MSNMKIISMLGHESKRIRADTRLTLRPCWRWFEEELAPLQDQIERLRVDVNKLMEARDGTVLSVTENSTRSHINLSWIERAEYPHQMLRPAIEIDATREGSRRATTCEGEGRYCQPARS